jgi:pSer/pThr/pTyr-binding forkhead associated (FHA) protein
MAKLIVISDGQPSGEFELDKDCITIGRKSNNDIQIENKAVSGHHAQVITILNDSFLEDLNSTNGTFVNSRQITKHALRDGDMVTIGNIRIQYLNKLASASQEENFESTMVIQRDAIDALTHGECQDSAQLPVQEDTNQEVPVEERPQCGRLQVLNGSNMGQELKLTKALTTIGRPGVSVAAITRRAQSYFIIHIEGGNAEQRPQVNGEPITTRAQPLQDHDIIEVGGIKMEFFVA